MSLRKIFPGTLFLLTGFIYCVPHALLAERGTAAGPASADSPATRYAPAIALLETAIRHELEHKQLPAFSIALVDDQRSVWAAGFGYEDAQRERAATANTIYRVGSVSKLFTDIGVLQLVDQGRLDLDAPVTDYLPEFKPDNQFQTPITLRQLMSHQSGLVREPPVGNYFDPTEPSLSETIASLNATSLVYPPESRTKYSNAALAVVGAILEEQLDVSHPEQIRKSIFEPLQMKHSSFEAPADETANLATGWMRTYDGRRFEAPTFALGTGPAGNLYASVNDLAEFMKCVLNRGRRGESTIVRSDTLDLMTTPITNREGVAQGFGLGFHVQDLDGYKKIGHGGAIYGFSTQFEALPERRLGVVAATSLDGANGVVGRLADYALRLMIAAKDDRPLPAYQTTRPLPPARVRQLRGKYREPDSQRFTRITELNGDVYMQRGTYRHELGARSDSGEIVTDSAFGFGMNVRRDDSGNLIVGDSVFAPVPDVPPRPCPDRWRGLIGEYGWDHNTLYILEEAGQLYALIEWFYYYPLTEIDRDTFLFPDYGLYHGEGLTFQRDETGNATEVVAAEVKFVRRQVGTKDGETFQITPVEPIEKLRERALAAAPPNESGDFRPSQLVDLVKLDPSIKLDVRYATTNNFMGEVFYKQPRAFLQRPAAEGVVRANKALREHGLGLLIHDAYRPWHVTKMFWDATPGELKDFVANPATGSRHNRGCAVDLTLYDFRSGLPIQMVAGYDEFSARSFPMYPGGTSRQRWYRELLRRTMEAEDFSVYEFEWWHFDYRDWTRYRIGNATFEELED